MGVFNSGIFNTPVFNTGVGQAVPDSPHYFLLIAPPSTPGLSPFAAAPRDPMVDHDFFAFARLASAQSYLDDVGQWMRDQLADGEELADMSEREDFGIDEVLSGKYRRRGKPRS